MSFKKVGDKQLQKRINFKSLITVLMAVLGVYELFMIFWIGVDKIITLAPLTAIIFITIYLLYKDDKIEKDNRELQKEIDKIKHLYDVRKKSEKFFDGTN